MPTISLQKLLYFWQSGLSGQSPAGHEELKIRRGAAGSPAGSQKLASDLYLNTKDRSYLRVGEEHSTSEGFPGDRIAQKLLELFLSSIYFISTSVFLLREITKFSASSIFLSTSSAWARQTRTTRLQIRNISRWVWTTVTTSTDCLLMTNDAAERKDIRRIYSLRAKKIIHGAQFSFIT